MIYFNVEIFCVPVLPHRMGGGGILCGYTSSIVVYLTYYPIRCYEMAYPTRTGQVWNYPGHEVPALARRY